MASKGIHEGHWAIYPGNDVVEGEILTREKAVEDPVAGMAEKYTAEGYEQCWELMGSATLLWA